MIYYGFIIFFTILFKCASLFAAANDLMECSPELICSVSLKYEGPYRFDSRAFCIHSGEEIGQCMTDAFRAGRPYMATLVCGKRFGTDMRGWFDGFAFQKMANTACTFPCNGENPTRADFVRRIMKASDTSDERISHVMVWQRDTELRSIAFRDGVDPEQWQWPDYFYDEERVADVWELTGDLCVEKKQYDHAIDCWERAIESLEKDGKPVHELQLLIANAHERNKNFEAAFNLYNSLRIKFCALKMPIGDLLFNMGLLCERQKKYESAEQYYRESVVELERQRVPCDGVLSRLAHLYASSYRFPDAIACYKRALFQMLPSARKGYINDIGFMYEKMKEYKRAAEHYIEVLKEDNRDAYALMNLLFLSVKEPDAIKSIIDSEMLVTCAQNYINLPEDDQDLFKCRMQYPRRYLRASVKAIAILSPERLLPIVGLCVL